MQKVFGGGDSRKKQKQNDRWLPEEEKFAVELVLKAAPNPNDLTCEA